MAPTLVDRCQVSGAKGFPSIGLDADDSAFGLVLQIRERTAAVLATGWQERTQQRYRRRTSHSIW